PAPQFLFSENYPSAAEISGILRRKSNGSAPGLDGISYVPYKKCPSLLPILVKLFKKIWETQEIPSSWATASVLLLSKSGNLADPADFRPISLTNTIGKIFFGIISNTSESFSAKSEVDNFLKV